ncbi:DUF3784 domain-containing protein [Sutcliffiella halmapala]|uniref:DUF3784 domain-containing protein n=1 Tax=Sutcliffiella halmapala TaxID=79882 RepID=UPI00111773DF|nr:DUF3784 domain-containing protein [Sutcliffiella halmapala]
MMETLGYIVGGLAMVSFGLLIWKKKMLHLIIGYSNATFYGDKEKYARNVGVVTIFLGVIIIFKPIFTLLFGDFITPFFLIAIVCLVILLGIVAHYWRFRF